MRKKNRLMKKKEKDSKVAEEKKKKQEGEMRGDQISQGVKENQLESGSGLGIQVKEDKDPPKMDDGYEDFGPGANP
uniref:MT0933-like antitoxin protein n=1 Tax=Caenorhabditis tropicalis TaxID=1561998 RepID=A0A1I7U4B1_9PELO